MAISYSFLFRHRDLCRKPRAGTQAVETFEGNKGWEGSQTSHGDIGGEGWKMGERGELVLM
jgi:hypothetical protein